MLEAERLGDDRDYLEDKQKAPDVSLEKPVRGHLLVLQPLRTTG